MLLPATLQLTEYVLECISSILSASVAVKSSCADVILCGNVTVAPFSFQAGVTVVSSYFIDGAVIDAPASPALTSMLNTASSTLRCATNETSGCPFASTSIFNVRLSFFPLNRVVPIVPTRFTVTVLFPLCLGRVHTVFDM